MRYSRELRDDVASIREVLVPAPTGAQILLGQLADVDLSKGPPFIKTEAARPNAWIYVDIQGADVGGYVKRAQQVVAEKVQLPPGYTMTWSGQYEYMLRAQQSSG